MRKHYSFSIISLKSSTQDGFETSHTTVGGDVTQHTFVKAHEASLNHCFGTF